MSFYQIKFSIEMLKIRVTCSKAHWYLDIWRMLVSEDDIIFTNTNTDIGESIAAWGFGDFSTSTEQHPTFSYKIPRSYKVILIVTDDNRFLMEFSMFIEVKSPPFTTTTDPRHLTSKTHEVPKFSLTL